MELQAGQSWDTHFALYVIRQGNSKDGPCRHQSIGRHALRPLRCATGKTGQRGKGKEGKGREKGEEKRKEEGRKSRTKFKGN